MLGALTVGHTIGGIGRSLREGVYMFWDTLWALVLGFALSGAVQAFASRGAMQRELGDHGPAATLRASLLGMVSSSCSYAAAATARSLFAGGADFVVSMVFMFASTNLVIEVGVVLVVLLGWPFLVAEFIGGALMVGLLVVAGHWWLQGRALAEAREAATEPAGGHDHHCHDHGAGSAGRWAEAAGYAMSDLRMLRFEMAVGFVVAGFLAELVPVHVWSDLFLRGHGFWTSVENAAVGPFVALISFVCSVGNVPLAAALWKGGISFGGVISFIFGDLITLPLLLVYRKQYGTRTARRLLAVFWAVMSLSGLATEYLFRSLGWTPARRPATIAGDRFGWNATTALDVVALGLFGVLFWLASSQRRRALTAVP